MVWPMTLELRLILASKPTSTIGVGMVSFLRRTGKRLPTRVKVVIHFKQTPHPVFGQNAPENKLVIRIQPDEGIQISFGLKEPGAGFKAKSGDELPYMDLPETQMLTAYERLLLDALNGDATICSQRCCRSMLAICPADSRLQTRSTGPIWLCMWHMGSERIRRAAKTRQQSLAFPM